MPTFKVSLRFLVLALLIISSQNAFASGGLTGALDQIGNQIESSGSDSSNSNTTSTPTAAATPAAPSVPAGPEFGPDQTPAVTPISSRNEPSVGIPANIETRDLNTTTDPATGIATTVKQNADGSKTVTKKDANGNLISEEFFPPGSDKPDAVKVRDPKTGNVTTTVTNKDGSEDILVTSADGFLVSEKHVEKERPSASMYDPETGTTTSSVKNKDGSRTITKKDKAGNVVGTETMPPPGSGRASASMYDPNTGKTTTSTRNSDGSRTVTQKDKDGNITSDTTEPAPGKGEAFASSRDPKTGIETTARGSGDNRTISDSRSWKGDDGKEHTVVTDTKGNTTEIVKDKNGDTVTTQWDRNDQKTETIERKDGSKTTVSPTSDGFIEEKTVKKDGTVETVKKDHSGNVMHESRIDKKGHESSVDDLGVRTETTRAADGSYVTNKTDANGNKRTSHYDKNGNLVNEGEERKSPKQPGEAYFEQELGGKMGEFEKLPQSAKNQYANSEKQIIENAEMELLRESQERERLQTEEDRRLYNEQSQKELEVKLGAIRQEGIEADKKAAEFAKKEDRLRKRRDAEDKIKDYDRKIYEASASGDKKKAEALSIEADKFSEESAELFELNDAEAKEIERKQDIRQKLAQRVTSRARSVADNELVSTEGLQDLKETVTDKAKWLSVGAEMQEETKKTTRSADRERAFAQAKQAEIVRLLSDPKTTAEEREMLYGLAEMADLSESGANEMLQSNAMLTAAGYGIDVAMTVTGGKLVTAAGKGVTAAATRVLAKETAEAVIVATTKKGVLTLAGEGATKAATGATRRVVSEEAAKTVERALTADVGQAAGRATESAATRVIGEKGVEVVKNAASKTAEVAGMDLKDIPGKLRGAADEAVPTPTASAPVASVADNAAPRQSSVADNALPENTAPSGKKPSEMTPQERQAFHDERAAKQAGDNFRNGMDPEPGDSLLLPEGPVKLPRPPGSYSKNMTQREIDKLFDGGIGRKLTPDEIVQKADLIRTGRAPKGNTDLMKGVGQRIFEPPTPRPAAAPAADISKGGTLVDGPPVSRPITERLPKVDHTVPAPSTPVKPTTQRLPKVDHTVPAQPKQSAPVKPATQRLPKVDHTVPAQPKPTAPAPAAKPAKAAAPKEAPHADRTMSLETLEDYAKNPRTRTPQRSGQIDDFPAETIKPKYRRDNFVEARSAWKKTPQAEREAFDQGVRDAIDEAAAMGDKWAKRAQADLKSGKFKYEYEPGLNYGGLAPGKETVLLNPLKGGKNLALESPDKLASTLIHEYAHNWKGPQKWAASEGRSAKGAATKGEYNEVRAFSAEANFNKNLRNARDLNGKAFDDSTIKELDTLMGVDSLPPGAPSTARGLQARKNLQEGLVDDYSYGKDYAGKPELAAERLSTFRGGGMKDIRQRLESLKGPNGEITPAYEAALKDITTTGGRTLPKGTPAPPSVKPTIEPPKSAQVPAPRE